MWVAMLLFCVSPIGASAPDTLRVLCIGNSFTYVDSADAKLRDIAASQGHVILLNSQTQGGYTFQRHLRRDETLSAIVYHRFDKVFLQDQSQTPAMYGADPRRCHYIADDAVELAERIRMYSPEAEIIMEETWSYGFDNAGGFGSMEEFDRLLKKGSAKMARRMKATMSPIGEAFRLCRETYPDINLYAADDKHQSAYGSYLKAAVNYLLLYGGDFSENTDCCSLNEDWCRKLREIATKVVK